MVCVLQMIDDIYCVRFCFALVTASSELTILMFQHSCQQQVQKIIDTSRRDVASFHDESALGRAQPGDREGG